MNSINTATLIALTLMASAQSANPEGISVIPAVDDMVDCTSIYRDTILGEKKYLVTCAYDPSAAISEELDYVNEGDVAHMYDEMKPQTLAKLGSTRQIVYTASETQSKMDALQNSLDGINSELSNLIYDMFGEFSKDVMGRVISEETVSTMRDELVAQLSGEISSLVTLEIEAAKVEFLHSDEFKKAVREATNR